MEIISDGKLKLFEMEAPKSKARGLRATIIEDFVTELNKDAGKKYKSGEKFVTIKKIEPRYVAFRVSHLKVPDLFYFLSECRSAKCGFRRAFYGNLKVKLAK